MTYKTYKFWNLKEGEALRLRLLYPDDDELESDMDEFTNNKCVELTHDQRYDRAMKGI